MTSDTDKMHYSDLISPDDSIKKLIEQLEVLNSSYGELVTAVKNNAKDIVRAMKDMSASTAEGRAKLDDAAIAASRLERAEKELAFSMSDVGKQVAWLKSQTASQNKMTSEQQARAQALAGSYDKLSIQVKDLTRRWKELSAEERANEKGDRILSQLMRKKQALADLDSQMKLQVTSMSALEKAQRKLEYLESDEGKQLIEVKRRISDIITGRNQEKQAIDELARAQQRLAEVRKTSYVAAQQVNAMAKEEARIAKLQAQVYNNQEGSYNRLAAQYELNKIKLNAMSKAERDNIEVGGRLEQQTREIYQEMIRLQEATGNHRLSVGNYTKAWNGLNVATSQVIRELPAAAVGINTFFLGISNNIPILVDEINKVRAANKLAIAEGKPTTSVIGEITGALFNWQTALVILLTYLSMHGKEVVAWATKLIKGSDAVITEAEQLEALSEELNHNSNSYGQNIVKLRELQQEWQNLSSLKEQQQWINDNKAAFDQLNLSVNGVTDAENILVKNTAAVVEAFQLRAKAAAAQSLAAQEYEKALRLQLEAESATQQGPSIADYLGAIPSVRPDSEHSLARIAGARQKHRLSRLRAESTAAMEAGDAYFKMAGNYLTAANTILSGAGIRVASSGSSGGGRRGGSGSGRGKQPIDLTDTINRNQIAILKRYEESITALQQDEFAKRRKALIGATLIEIAQLDEKYRKNEEYINNVDKKYKALTEEQKKQLALQQELINKSIINANKQLLFELEQLSQEQQIYFLGLSRETVDWHLEGVVASLEQEKQLRLQQLADEEEFAKESNALLEDSGVSEVEITTEYAQMRAQIIADYDKKIFNLRKTDIDAQVELAKKGSEEELKLLLRQNELARQLAISENRAKSAEERQSEEQINALFDQRSKRIEGTFSTDVFNQAQALEAAQFEVVKHSETEITKFKLQQEKDRWEYQIKLAKAGALNWSDAQIAAAEYTVKRIERELKEASDIINLIGEKGIGGALLDRLGFNSEQIDALSEAKDIILDNIKAIFDAEVQLAEQEVKLAEDRVAATQKAYESEIEARNNGYANNVATAKQELQLAKKTQAEKQKLLETARKRQEAVDTATQASSLVTASANLWASFSSVPIVGPTLALAAIAAMWGSYAVAKVKAAQVAKQSSQEYGEGGLEFLEGGSHASGHDIDLNTVNSKGKNMRAEGGEALAIINRKSTKRYRRQLPGIINSLNKGLFEEQYARAFEKSDVIQANIIAANNNSVDLSNVERAVEAIRKQNEHKVVVLGDGTTVEIRKNVRRYYR